MRVYRTRRTIIIFMSLLLVLILCLGYVNILKPSYAAYADIGADVKETIKGFPYYNKTVELSDEESEKRIERLDSLDPWFAVPSGYSSVNTYISDINPYETREEWLSVSVQKRVELSQIPEDMLKTMSTDELIVSCLNYNLLIDLVLYDTIRDGFEILKKQFNGFEELLARPDAGHRLVELYKAVDYDELYENDRGAYLHMLLLHTLLCEDSVLDSLNETEVSSLINASHDKYMKLLNEGSPLFNYENDVRVCLKCLYVHDPSVKDVIDNSDALKCFISDENVIIPIDDIDDGSVGKIASVMDEYYIAEKGRSD